MRPLPSGALRAEPGSLRVLVSYPASALEFAVGGYLLSRLRLSEGRRQTAAAFLF